MTARGASARPDTLDFLAERSDMAARVRAHDWAATPLGPIGDWSAELKTAVYNLLESRFPAALVWGAGLVTIYNDGFQPILGNKPEALGRSFADIWSEAWAEIGPIVDRAFAGEATFIEDYPLLINRSGEPEQAYFTFCYSPVRAADGRVLGMVDTVVETTNRIKTETALRESEERQAFLLDLSDALRSLADADDVQATATRMLGEHLKVDRTYYVELDEARQVATVQREYLRTPAPSVVGSHPFAAFEAILEPMREGQRVVVENSEADATIREEDLAAYRGLALRAFVDTPLVKNGALVGAMCAVSATPRRWSETEIVLVEETAERTWSAVERARAEAVLRESAEQQAFLLALSDRLRPLTEPGDVAAAGLRLLRRYLHLDRAYIAEIRGPDHPVVILAEDGRRDLAPMPAELLPSDFPEAFGKAAEGLLVVEDIWTDTGLTELDRQSLASIALTSFIVAPLNRGAKGMIWALVAGVTAPRPWSRNQGLAVAEVAERVWATMERARAEAALHDLNDTLETRVAERTSELEQAHEQLRHSQKLEAMGQLTGGVAHDFNNLLSPIVGSLDLLQRKRQGSEREQRLIDGALQSAERARLLVQRLLAFARRQPLKPQPVDVRQLVEGMADLIASTSGPRVTVELDIDDNLPAASADANQVEMALLNLSVNARDAMPDGGTLTISAKQSVVAPGERAELRGGRYVRLSVADTGTGMDAETQRRAVEPFFSTKGIGKGTGLGLSMVHGLAAQLGGALLIESRPGLGTCIELWLPASEEAAPSQERTEDTDGAAMATGTVLLVDDEGLVRASTADMLIELGYAVVEAASAEEALRLVDKGTRFDLLVTDHLMAGLSGTELAREVRSRRPGTRALVVSGFAEVDTIAPDLTRLIKPFRQADLAAKLAELNEETSA